MRQIAVFLLCVMSFKATSAFFCEVEVQKVLIYSNGYVNIFHSGRNDFTYICNLNSPYKEVSVTTCAMWTAFLQNVQQNQNKAVFYYKGSGSCESLATYGNSPAPVYIGTTSTIR